MREWVIRPFEGLGELRFATPRSVVRVLLKGEFRSFKKSVASSNVTDAYDHLGLHLYYDQEDRLEFIEAFPPCDPTYDSIHFFDQQLESVLMQLENLGFVPRYENEGYFFEQLGFVLYVPDSTIKAVSAYSRGYYISNSKD